MSCKVRSELEAAFEKLDANHDGYVTGSELQSFMHTLDAYKSFSAQELEEASKVGVRKFGEDDVCDGM